MTETELISLSLAVTTVNECRHTPHIASRESFEYNYMYFVFLFFTEHFDFFYCLYYRRCTRIGSCKDLQLTPFFQFCTFLYSCKLLLRTSKFSRLKFLIKHTHNIHVHVQWNLSITDTLGNKSSVLIKKVSLSQTKICTLLYEGGTVDSVLIEDVSLFQRSLIAEFHCIHTCMQSLFYPLTLYTSP